MGSYIETSLMPGEQVVHTGTISIFSVLSLLIFGAIILLIAFICLVGGAGVGIAFSMALFGCLPLLVAYLRYSSTECALTNRRVIAKFGFIRRQTIDLDLRKAESIRLEQGILGRIFNFGSIVVSGAGNPQAPIPGIKQPMDFRKAFLAVQEQATQAKPVV